MLSNLHHFANYWAIFVSGVAYWLFGTLWYSLLFGGIYEMEIEKHGIKIEPPPQWKVYLRLGISLLLNILLAIATDFLLFNLGGPYNVLTLMTSIKLGLLLGVLYSASSMYISYSWESRSAILILIDCGYPILGNVMIAVILFLWR
jgi:hypothetical protein